MSLWKRTRRLVALVSIGWGGLSVPTATAQDNGQAEQGQVVYRLRAAQQPPPNPDNDPSSYYQVLGVPQVQDLANVQVPDQPQRFVYLLEGGGDPGTGASLEPADEALRAQLDLPKGQGLVVTSVAPDSPAAHAGLKANDILLILADQPLAQPDDVSKALKGAGDKELGLKLIRSGKPITIQVRPLHRVTLGPPMGGQNEYFIGVQVRPLDDTLRAHLDPLDAQGLVATEVLPDSPALKAGLKPHDILVSLGDKPLGDTQALIAAVQATQGKPVDIKIIRSGKTQTITVTPGQRPAELAARFQFQHAPHGVGLGAGSAPWGKRVLGAEPTVAKPECRAPPVGLRPAPGHRFPRQAPRPARSRAQRVTEVDRRPAESAQAGVTDATLD
jgi:membrane-associated protease RseP (regulator of RpoE activity)